MSALVHTDTVVTSLFFYNFLILLDPAHITSFICIQLVCWGKPPMYNLNPTISTVLLAPIKPVYISMPRKIHDRIVK